MTLVSTPQHPYPGHHHPGLYSSRVSQAGRTGRASSSSASLLSIPINLKVQAHAAKQRRLLHLSPLALPSLVPQAIRYLIDSAGELTSSSPTTSLSACLAKRCCRPYNHTALTTTFSPSFPSHLPLPSPSQVLSASEVLTAAVQMVSTLLDRGQRRMSLTMGGGGGGGFGGMGGGGGGGDGGLTPGRASAAAEQIAIEG